MTDYQVSASFKGCTPQEGSKITTATQCKAACQSIGKTMRTGSFLYSPGCLYAVDAGVCYWNTRTDVKWDHVGYYEVCKKKEGGTTVGRVNWISLVTWEVTTDRNHFYT